MCQSLFFVKVAGFKPEFYLKRDSCTGVLLGIVQTFQEQLLCKKFANGCFWSLLTFNNFIAVMLVTWILS